MKVRSLVVIPSDPIKDYEDKGTSSWLEEYFNPNGFFDEVYVLSPKEKEARNIYGLKIIPVSSNKHFKKELKKINPLYVRAYGGYWATDYANYNRVSKIPVVSSVHDTNKKLMHESIKFSDYVFSMSEVVSEILIQENLAHKDFISVLGNRVNTGLFASLDYDKKSILENYNIPTDKKIILHLGRKSYEKNIENVIKSMSYLGDNFVLVLIGPGDFKDYGELVKALNLDKKVFNIGKVDNNKLPAFFCISDVFCVPSRWEGFGLVFIEAASCLTKIVTSNIAPMNAYLVNDSVMNILVDDYENPESLKDAICTLVNNKKKNDKTRTQIIERFDTKVVSEKEIEFYKKVKYRRVRITKTYIKWYFNCWYEKEFLSLLKKIIKVPKRLWLKIR